MRLDPHAPAYKDKASQAIAEESFGALRADFAERATNLKHGVTANKGDSCGVEHVSISGLPCLGGSAHASIGNGHIHVAAVVGARVPRDLSASLAGAKPSGLVTGGVHQQTYRCCQIIEQVLLVCQSQWCDLVRLTVHMADLGEAALEAFEQAVHYFFRERGCPSVAVSVVGCAQLLLSASVQIEGTAVRRAGALSPCAADMGGEADGGGDGAQAQPGSLSPTSPSPDPGQWEATTAGGTSVSTAASGTGLLGRWRSSRESSAEQRAAVFMASPLSSSSPSPPQQQNSSPGGWPGADAQAAAAAAYEVGRPQDAPAVLRQSPPSAHGHQRSRPPPRSRRGLSEPASATFAQRTAALTGDRRPSGAEEALAGAPAEPPAAALQPAAGGGGGGGSSFPGHASLRGRELSPALRWLAGEQEQRPLSPAWRRLLQPEGVADNPAEPSSQPRSASTLHEEDAETEQMFLSTHQLEVLSRQLYLQTGALAETGTILDGEGTAAEVEAAAPRRPRRTWVQKASRCAIPEAEQQPADKVDKAASATSATAPAPAASAGLDPAAPNFWPRSEATGNAFLREGSPLMGHEQSLSLQELPADQARHLGLRFQGDHNMLWRVHMEASDTCRTVRLGPGNLLCKHLVGCKRVWSYTFDIVLAHTLNSFVNVGLVEWIAALKEGVSTESLMGMNRACEVPLSDLMGVETSEDRGANLAWQHASESPRQMMLGCRKGVKWYGNSGSEPVFNDDFCDGSLLHFRCDYTFSPEGLPIQVRLWLLPSPVVFKAKGHQVVTLSGPLFEYQLPPTSTSTGTGAATRSLWVPAITLYNQNDKVLFAWRSATKSHGGETALGGGSAAPAAAGGGCPAHALQAVEGRSGTDGASTPLSQAEAARRDLRSRNRPAFHIQSPRSARGPARAGVPAVDRPVPRSGR